MKTRSSSQVYGKEYSFGFHDLPVTGIYHHEPRQAGDLGRKFQFRESVMLGLTDFLEEDIALLIETMGQEEFTGESYHLVRHNCNTFTCRLAETLTGTASILVPFSSLPFLEYLDITYPMTISFILLCPR